MVGEVAGMIGKFKGHGGWRPDKLLEICVDNSNNIGTSCMVKKKWRFDFLTRSHLEESIWIILLKNIFLFVCLCVPRFLGQRPWKWAEGPCFSFCWVSLERVVMEPIFIEPWRNNENSRSVQPDTASQRHCSQSLGPRKAPTRSCCQMFCRDYISICWIKYGIITHYWVLFLYF